MAKRISACELRTTVVGYTHNLLSLLPGCTTPAELATALYKGATTNLPVSSRPAIGKSIFKAFGLEFTG
jgi:hypothetical protein